MKRNKMKAKKNKHFFFLLRCCIFKTMKHYTFHKNLANIHIHPSHHQRSERGETESHNKMMANTKMLTKKKKKNKKQKTKTKKK